MIYKITPIAKPRMTYRDSARSKQNRIQGMRPCVARYFEFVNQVKAEGVDLHSGDRVEFGIQMPKTWAAKKKLKMDRMPHTQTPDLTNLIKALEDACFEHDSHIWWYSAILKRWSYEGYIKIN